MGRKVVDIIAKLSAELELDDLVSKEASFIYKVLKGVMCPEAKEPAIPYICLQMAVERVFVATTDDKKDLLQILSGLEADIYALLVGRCANCLANVLGSGGNVGDAKRGCLSELAITYRYAGLQECVDAILTKYASALCVWRPETHEEISASFYVDDTMEVAAAVIAVIARAIRKVS